MKSHLMANPELGFRRRSRPVAAQRRRGSVLFAITVILGGSLMAAFASGSPKSVLAAGAALSAIVWMFWRADDLPILLLPTIYQWLQVALKPIMSAVYAQPVDEVFRSGVSVEAPTEPAALYGLAGVVCLSLGICIGARRSYPHAVHATRLEAQRWEPELLLRVCLSAIVLGHLATAFAGLTGPAYQPVLALGGLRLVGVFILAYWCFVNSKGYQYLVPVLVFEIVIGMTGFFADFRSPLLATGIAALAAKPRLRPSSIVLWALAVIISLLAASFWSEVKMDYRSFLNHGSGTQSVSEPLEARVIYLYNAVSEFDSTKLEDGFDRLLERLSYTDYLGATLMYVPVLAPHENGELLGKAVENALMPRVLFPDKPPLPSDSDVTSRYTGLDFDQNTSVSIGYLGELYVDFGYVGSLIATTVIGVMAGIGYRVLRDYQRTSRLITAGVCLIYALSFVEFGAALVKFTNAAVLAFTAALVIQRMIAPAALAYMMSRRAVARLTPRPHL